MRIREVKTITASSGAGASEAWAKVGAASDERSGWDLGAADVLESIRELDAQYAAGEIEMHAYFVKKRALIRML